MYIKLEWNWYLSEFFFVNIDIVLCMHDKKNG